MKGNKMFVVKDNKKDAYLVFDRIVDDITMEIITTVEPVGAYQLATQLSSEDKARLLIKSVNVNSYDTSECVVINLDDVKHDEEQKAKEKAQAVMVNAWKNTSEETRIQKLREILKAKSEKEVDEWLDYVKEPDKQKYIEALKEPEEDEMTKLLKNLSDEQKEQLKQLLNKGE